MAEKEEKLTGMVDITEKPLVYRKAIASGSIRLKESTIEAIRLGLVKKGDALTVARLAAILAVKESPRIIPLCHSIPITGVMIDFMLEPMRIMAIVEVTSTSRTGVEMEALTGVSVALLNIWDMVKYMEKDETGNYPNTVIEDIKVIKKRKNEC